MREKLTIAVVIALAAMLLLPATAQAKGNDKGHKVDVCHAEGNGSYHLINISEKAVDRHVANHGDGFPGDPVPGIDGYEFDQSCVPVEVAVCEAATVSGTVGPDVVLASIWDAEGVTGLQIPTSATDTFTLVVPPSGSFGGNTWELPGEFFVRGIEPIFAGPGTWSQVFTLDCGQVLTGVVVDQTAPPVLFP